MKEWSERIGDEQLKRVLELGEFLTVIPDDQKPMRMTLIASSLFGDGIARSTEEAYIMLTEACVHTEVWRLIKEYDQTLKEFDRYVSKVKKAYRECIKENKRLRQALKEKENGS